MELNNNFMEFVDNTPNAYYCVDNIRKKLIENGYKELYESENWDLNYDGKYFVVRNDASLIAFQIGKKDLTKGFNIVSSHTDSPSFSIKPNSEIFENGCVKLNTEPYGGMINYSWLDRPLSIAGRVIVDNNAGEFETKLINIDKDLLVIPSQAIHINRDVNTKNELNKQTDMLPVLFLSDKKNDGALERYLGYCLGLSPWEKICDYDLYLYNRDKAKKIGNNKELLLSPRLDDLASVYPSLCSFIDSENENNVNVFCSFNNEEIGSLTSEGADSTFLLDVLSRICESQNLNLRQSISNSFIVSADNAHAIHPNAAQKNDLTNKVYLNKGIAIKHNKNYATDAITSSLMKSICENAKVPYQDYAHRSDMACGSTLGRISQSHVPINTVDIGIPQLAMHSANETIGTKDLLYMYKAILEFYKTTFKKEQNKIKIIRKGNN